ALYFLLAGLMVKFRFLGYGVGLVLVFVGCKMLGREVLDVPPEISLGIVLGILAASILASLLRPAPPDPEEEVVLHDPAENAGEDFQSSPAGRELDLEE
ncbi:MAG TPA: hypothetical protein VIJ61_05445, partial [Thermoanaerobaculia bacterium]